ncbi:MAG: ATP-binding protein [Salinivirgaceae bacterium]|nr:ATP-binding protein [Salinivirgaceae bacterium]
MKIERDVIGIFREWKDSTNRKPILLKGARQIGKTWAMETFGNECFEYCAKFDFDRQPELKSVFQTSKEPERIVRELALYCNVPLIPGRTLLIFDEIQECKEALNSLKYFCEDLPDFHIIAAGSLLGVAVRKRQMTVPVGKVDIVRLYPISFKEFLRASDEKTYQYVDSLAEPQHLPEIVLNKLKLEYRRYMISGGMPEAVVAMLENRGMQAVDDVLQNILDLYELDFAKYAAPRDIPRIHAVWHSLPSQLAKENRKFIYKYLKTGARAKDYEDALLWLEEAGMVYRICNITKPAMPLKAYEDTDAFKLYACDCGLLRRMANLPATTILDPTSNFTEFKGAMAENAVLQSFMPILNGITPNYWSPDSSAEVEFVIQWNDEIIPIEVKAENSVSGRSLSVYNDKYQPKNRIRFSSLNLQSNNGLLSCPSPLAQWFGKWIN